jgi:hypothetical protein
MRALKVAAFALAAFASTANAERVVFTHAVTAANGDEHYFRVVEKTKNGLIVVDRITDAVTGQPVLTARSFYDCVNFTIRSVVPEGSISKELLDKHFGPRDIIAGTVGDVTHQAVCKNYKK